LFISLQQEILMQRESPSFTCT